ncbi:MULTISPECIES: RNA polymerase sigma factor [unclassified Brevundimonas]|uniref:RNA polymerase sigma factor n=1 Tax=unclassified Brevundimonas TaxID=2622653 RepID=UPI0025B9ADDA|nr:MULTISPECIES: sigma-70 family RNA polymerase sigma factor [unclassified Brevundimonas]
MGLKRGLPRDRPEYPTYDHIVPKSHGGGHGLVNGLLKHFACIRRKTYGLVQKACPGASRCQRIVTAACYRAPMGLVSTERAIWLGQWVFPNEAELRAWLSRRALAGMEVDDIVQETYAVLAGLERVDHIRNPRTYMFEVAKTVVYRSLRRSRVISLDALAEAVDGLQAPSDAPSPEQAAADRQELGRVAALIAALPPKCREVFTLRKIQGLSQREVAQRLGLSESTVEKHIGKALGILTAKIGRGGSWRVDASRNHEADQHAPDRTARERRRD